LKRSSPRKNESPFSIETIPRRATSENATSPSPSQPSSQPNQRGGGSLEEERVKKKKRSAAKHNPDWEDEECMLVPLDEYTLVPIHKDERSKPGPAMVRNPSRFFCFTQLLTEEVVKSILEHSNGVCLLDYWIHLTIRIYVQGCTHTKDHKINLKSHWPIPFDIFQGRTMSERRWTTIFCDCSLPRDLWFLLSKNTRLTKTRLTNTRLTNMWLMNTRPNTWPKKRHASFVTRFWTIPPIIVELVGLL
jgi:hypothetical protein